MPDSEARPGLVQRVWQNNAFRYLLAGGSAFLVDAGLLALFREVFGLPVWLATGIAFVLSFFFTYFVQRMFAFGSDLPHGRALWRYLALVGFNTLATMGVVSLIALTPLGWFVGKLVATLAATVWNFFIYRAWVFPPAVQASPEGIAAAAAEKSDTGRDAVTSDHSGSIEG